MTKTYTDQEMVAIAELNIDRYLGNVVNEEMQSDEIYEEVYVLAFAALANAGVTLATARAVAARVAERWS